MTNKKGFPTINLKHKQVFDSKFESLHLPQALCSIFEVFFAVFLPVIEFSIYFFPSVQAKTPQKLISIQKFQVFHQEAIDHSKFNSPVLTLNDTDVEVLCSALSSSGTGNPFNRLANNTINVTDKSALNIFFCKFIFYFKTDSSWLNWLKKLTEKWFKFILNLPLTSFVSIVNPRTVGNFLRVFAVWSFGIFWICHVFMVLRILMKSWFWRIFYWILRLREVFCWARGRKTMDFARLVESSKFQGLSVE